MNYTGIKSTFWIVFTLKKEIVLYLLLQLLLIEFYKKVFGCRSIGEKRDLHGAWLDKMIGILNAHIVGEHLVMPGYDTNHPTIEIFSYD